MAVKERPAPIPSVRRLPLYLRYLKALPPQEHTHISCTRIARELGQIPIQVRKDLAVTGINGKPKVGYPVSLLIRAIEDFLGWDRSSEAFLLGAGSLGMALMEYEQFQHLGLRIVAAFDIDPGKIGRRVNGVAVHALDALPAVVRERPVLIGILTVPGEAAQEIAQRLTEAGVRALWNFTPATLAVPEEVVVENVQLSCSLAVLTSRLRMSPEGVHRSGPRG